MHYIVDGYNLLFRLIEDRGNLEKIRRNFIQDLDEKAELLNLDITLVFDGHYQEDDQTRTHYRNLEIIYSSHGESADELIVSEISSSLDTRNEVVVTSDRGLARRVKKFHVKTETAESFYSWLMERYKKRLKRVPKKAKPRIPKPQIEKISKADQEYLEIFEKRLQEEEAKPKAKKREKSSTEKEVDDFKRWQRIFEEKLEE